MRKLLRKNNFEIETGREFDGVNPATINVAQLIESKKPGRLVKLHGSIGWKRTETNIELYSGQDNVFDPNSNVVLYPGFKGLPMDPPFDSFYKFFERKLSQAKIVVFVGFSFRDSAINDIIYSWDGDSSERKVIQVVINLDKTGEQPNPGPLMGAIKYFSQGFNQENCRRVS